MSYSQDKLSNSQETRICDGSGGQTGRFNLQKRQIQTRLLSDSLSVEFTPILKKHASMPMSYDVEIRQDQPIRLPDNSRSYSMVATLNDYQAAFYFLDQRIQRFIQN